MTEENCPECAGRGIAEYPDSQPYTVERPSPIGPHMPGKLTTRWRTVWASRTCVSCKGTGKRV